MTDHLQRGRQGDSKPVGKGTVLGASIRETTAGSQPEEKRKRRGSWGTKKTPDRSFGRGAKKLPWPGREGVLPLLILLSPAGASHSLASWKPGDKGRVAKGQQPGAQGREERRGSCTSRAECLAFCPPLSSPCPTV